jgi:lipopolysaccharide exporter
MTSTPRNQGGEAPEPDLRSAALTGFRWFGAARLIAEIAIFGSTLVLARLISPEEYGQAIVALAFYYVATSMFGEAFNTPLVQRKELERRHLEVAGLLSVLVGLALAAVFALALPPACEPIFGGAISELLPLLAPVFVLNSLTPVPRAILQRRLDFRPLGVLEVVPLLLGTAATVALAIGGLNAEAIVLGPLVQALVEAIALVAFARPPLPRWRRGSRELLGFGGPAGAASLVFSVWRHSDYAIVGARLDATQAGLFWRAYKLALEYQGKISGIMLKLAFPIYSRTRDTERMLAIRSRIVRAHSAALFPLLAALIALAPTLIPLLYGPRWEGAIVPTQILAVAGLSAVVLTGTGPLLLAAGKPHVLLWANVGNAVTYLTMVLLVAPYGLVALCAGVVAFQAASFVAMHILLERTVGLSFREVLADIAPAGLASAALLAVAMSLGRLLDSWDVADGATLACAGGAGLVAYLAVLRGGFPAAWGDARLLARSVVARRRAVPRPI